MAASYLRRKAAFSAVVLISYVVSQVDRDPRGDDPIKALEQIVGQRDPIGSKIPVRCSMVRGPMIVEVTAGWRTANAAERCPLEALHVDEVNAVCQAAEMLDGGTAGAVLRDWLRRFSSFATSKQLIAAEFLLHADRSNPLLHNCARVIAAGRPLLFAAQHSREVRANLNLDQILDMVVAIARIHVESDYSQPILQTALDDLRTTNDWQPAQDKEPPFARRTAAMHSHALVSA